jgi:hypothetical protein
MSSTMKTMIIINNLNQSRRIKIDKDENIWRLLPYETYDFHVCS